MLAASVAGCTVPVPRPVPALSPAVTRSTPGPSPELIGGVPVSPVPGVAVDRPSYPDPHVTPKGFAAAPAGVGLAGYAAQKIAWAGCGDETTDRCARVLAPLDYAEPDAQAITLSLRKRLATKKPVIGTLFINPGGPGGSGMDLVTAFDTRGLERFDVVGWDPRGSGQSTPVTCYGSKQTDALNNLDASPDTAKERAALLAGYAAFGKSCWEHSGVLLDHISTADTVRDLDLLRTLVGDDKLFYLGYSYGTQIGATYADMFPQTTGRLVLDSAVDITGSEDAVQAAGFDLALGNFASWCAKRECDLGTSKKAVLASVTGLFDRLDAKPLAVGDRQLTQTLAVTGVAMELYGDEAQWPELLTLVDRARDGDGAGLLWAADQLNDRADDGTYGSMFYSFPAIACLDEDDKGVLDADRLWRKDEKAAPIFGDYMGPSYTCPLWPVRPAPQVTLRGEGAPPIVVIGAKGDSATPYQQAVTMAQQLTSAVLVTYTGEGHGTYGGKSACVDDLVVAYLTGGTVPKDGVVCH